MKQIMKWTDAWEIAERIAGELDLSCTRIQIAGSLRRMKPEVGDIEIVAEPIFKKDLFGAVSPDHMLNEFDYSTLGKLVKNGSKFKQIELNEGINLDLFIVTPPAEWGVQLLIRTGPADFSHRFVMPKTQGGMLHSWQKVRDGAMWHGDHKLLTPEEEDVFNFIDMPYLQPQERK